MKFFKRTYSVDYSNLISKLEKGDENSIQDLLWQPKNKIIQYLPHTVSLIQKLRKNKTTNDSLTIYQKNNKGHFELVIFEIPWVQEDIPYSPLIIDKSNSKIIGIMLPFNELEKYLSKKESKDIGYLGMIWTTFVMKYRFQ